MSAESSIIFNLYLFANCLIFSQLGILPIKLGINKALVLLVIFSSIFLISICNVSISQSTKIGLKLLSTIADTAVPKFKQGVIISLFFLKSITFKASVKAEDPELTIKPNFLANNFEIFFSKTLTDLPI